MDFEITDKSEFREDGWVYLNGSRAHKWFCTPFANRTFRVWEPKISDKSFIPILEEKRWKNLARVQKRHTDVFTPFFESIKDKKIVAAHKNGYVEFKNGDWNWLLDKPEEIINQELADKYFSLQAFLDRAKYVHTRYRHVLLMNIEKNYLDEMIKENKTSIKIKINGREYEFSTGIGPAKGKYLFCSNFPENVVEVEML